MRWGGRAGDIRGVLTRLRIYSLTEDDADWHMSLHVDRLTRAHRVWVGGKAMYLLPTQNEEWARSKAKLRSLNDQGDRPVAHIGATNRPHAKDAPKENADGLARQKYICRGARRTPASAVWQEWGLYNWASGDAAGIVYRPGDRPPMSLPAWALVSFPKYFAPTFLPDLPKVPPVAPIERILDCMRRCSRAAVPLLPARGLTFHKSQGMTCGAWRDAECAVVRPATPSFGKSNPLQSATPSDISTGRGVFGESGFGARAICLLVLCRSGRILLHADNAITDGRGRAARRDPDAIRRDKWQKLRFRVADSRSRRAGEIAPLKRRSRRPKPPQLAMRLRHYAPVLRSVDSPSKSRGILESPDARLRLSVTDYGSLFTTGGDIALL